MLRLIISHQGKLRTFDASCPKLEELLAQQDALSGEQVSATLELVQKRKREKVARPENPIPCPYEAIVALYAQECPDLKQVGVLDGVKWERDRKPGMKEMWDWILTSKRPDGSRRATTAEEALEWIREYFGRVKLIGWMMKPSGTGQHANWTASFDYLITSAGITKVIEETS